MKWKIIKGKLILWFEAITLQQFLNCEPTSSMVWLHWLQGMAKDKILFIKLIHFKICWSKFLCAISGNTQQNKNHFLLLSTSTFAYLLVYTWTSLEINAP